MTKLSTLRSHLDAMHRRRLRLRLTTAWTGFAVVAIWAILAAFAADRIFTMNRPQRFISLMLVAGGIFWAWRRIAAPMLIRKETEIDMALLVERRQGIGSDLVAALQFESAEAATWGSSDLREAVIERAVKFGNDWNLPPEKASKEFKRRTIACGITVFILFAGVLISPRYATSFVNRMFMGSAHYPGGTGISQVLINGIPVKSSLILTPYGEAIRFEIHGSGKLPDEGYAILRPVGERTESRLRLTRVSRDAAVFAGTLPAVVNPLRYQLYLGDAWTDSTTIQLIPLPVIETKLIPTSPAYAAAAAREVQTPRAGTLELSVAEGSRVDLEVTCRNKRLKDVTVTVAGAPFNLKASTVAGKSGEVWALDTMRTPLAKVTEPLLYEVQVTDEDDMRLPQPVRGSLRIKTDLPPIVVASTASRLVMPNATVPITYRVTDDYGIQKLQLRLEVTGTNGVTSAPMSMPIRNLTGPILRDRLPVADTFKQPLDKLNLIKGDQIRVTVEAADYRGTNMAGKTAASDSIVLRVTDEAGILSEIAEPDARTATVIDDIINKQLGITTSTRKESNP